MTFVPSDDEAIRALLRRLARPHPSGGHVIERATLLAEGAEFPAAMAWITAHAGVAEASVGAAPRRGLHGARTSSGSICGPSKPLRYVLPTGALA